MKSRWWPFSGSTKVKPPTAENRATPAADFVNSIGMKFEQIPAGSFLMGLPGAGHHYEEYQHSVTITKEFCVGLFPVTQGEYQAVMGSNPSQFREREDLPVEMVSWNEAMSFCGALSNLEARERTYRLPTEAEWEYCCRAGTATRFYFGESLSASEANFDGRHPYGSARKGRFLKRTSAVG